MAIASVVQRGNLVYVYNENGRHTATITVGNGEELRGFTGSAVSIKRFNNMYLYDETGRHISTHPA